MGEGRMTWDASLTSLLEDEITVEPFSAETSGRVQTYGTAISYAALIQRGAKRVIGPQGREVISNIQVYIPERVHIDQRSRVTLPAGFVPNQPPILGIEPLKGLGLDHTAVYL
jgi:hypothetical protein